MYSTTTHIVTLDSVMYPYMAVLIIEYIFLHIWINHRLDVIQETVTSTKLTTEQVEKLTSRSFMHVPRLR